MALTVNLSVLFLCIVGLTEGVITSCVKQTACSCLTNTGVTVDLTPLAMTGGAKFKDVQAPNGDQFSWNPCNSFTEGACQNVAGCQIVAGGGGFNSIGTQDSVSFVVGRGIISLVYFATTGSTTRTSSVTLQCSQSEGTLTANGAIPARGNNFNMVLSSKYACVNGHNTTPGGNTTPRNNTTPAGGSTSPGGNSTPGGNTTPGGGGIAAAVSLSVLGTLLVIAKLLTWD